MAVTALDIIVFEWSMVVVTLALVMTRLYVRFSCIRVRTNANNRISTYTITPVRREWWSWSDFWVVVAWIGFVGLAVLDTMHYQLGYLMLFQDHSTSISWDKMQTALKVQYSRDAEYYVCMYAIKVAMLCFYHEFIPKERMFKSWIAMKVLCVLIPVAWLYTTLTILFQCVPIKQWWSSMDWPEHCWFSDPDNSIIGIHIGTDFLIYILPLFVLYSVKSLSTRQKIQAGFMFFIGFGLLLIAGAVFAVQTVPSWNENGTPLAAWILNTSEQTAAIFVACAPAFRTWLVRGVFGRSPSPTKKNIPRPEHGSWDGGDETLVAGTIVSSARDSTMEDRKSPKVGSFEKIDEEIAEFDFGIQLAEGRLVRGSGVNEMVMEIPRPLDDIEIESQKRLPSVIFGDITVDTGVDDNKCIMPPLPGTATTT